MRLLTTRLLLFFMLLQPAFACFAQTAPSEGNHLRYEKSPYLLQHASNPVNWYPWGEEAFSKARREGKPIFLSVGYSTCHWCHVMEEESFENPEIAQTLNTFFIAIKVDREERPDVDRVYMDALKLMTGSGGWPMNLFLTHDLKPFFAGTYFPAKDRVNKPGFNTILNGIANKWFLERESIESFSQGILQNIQRIHQLKETAGKLPDESVLRQGAKELQEQYDAEFGGFGEAPKFPQPQNIMYLLRAYKRFKNPAFLEMSEKTLRSVRHGGIYDHLGGGVHRYSTDREWFKPHFEKMLYDQALLSNAYLELYSVTQNIIYAQIARDIFRYVLRELKSQEGPFYSAEDADSAVNPADPQKKKEGAFYVWDEKEIRSLFDAKVAPIVLEHYGVRIEGNVLKDPFFEFKKKNILHIQDDGMKLANQYKVSPEFVSENLYAAKQKLFELRQSRPHPLKDDKILTDWNGLMISALARGGVLLEDKTYLEAAEKAADFILTKMKKNDNSLLHRYRDGEAAIPGFLSDYAFFIQSLLDLYEADFKTKYLLEAKQLNIKMMELFTDEDKGGFFLSPNTNDPLIVRTKDIDDGALPSGNGVAILNLLRLSRFLMDPVLEETARTHLEAFSEIVRLAPSRYPQMLMSIDWLLGPSFEIVLAGKPGEFSQNGMLDIIRSVYIPQKVLLMHPSEGKEKKSIERLLPFIENQKPLRGNATAYICQNYVCDLPTDKPAKLKELLQNKSGQSTAFRLFG